MPQGPRGIKKNWGAKFLEIQFLKNWGADFFENSILKNWGAKFFENSIFHELLIQGGLGGAEHPPARYKVKN